MAKKPEKKKSDENRDDRFTWKEGDLVIINPPDAKFRNLDEPEEGEEGEDATSNEIEAAENYGGVPGEKTSENEEDIHEE